jgi:hypothetical protein
MVSILSNQNTPRMGNSQDSEVLQSVLKDTIKGLKDTANIVSSL